MKLQKIKWSGHEILGNLELDFTNPATGMPYKTIVIAGENGTGKTTILETIYTFLNQGPITPFEYIEYRVNDKIYHAFRNKSFPVNTFFNIRDIEAETIIDIRSDRSNNPSSIKSNTTDPRHYGCAYTKAKTDYIPKEIRSITGQVIDGDIYKETSETDATSLKQLLIDIETQDNNDFARLGRENSNVSWERFEPTSRRHRFSSAFNTFFEGILSYDGIDTVNGKHEVLFRKNNIQISINKLSTGESQIVYRGTYLLKNADKLKEGVIFIDEPEISMHPSWQKKILSYYKGLFTYNGQQTAQIIVTTHSEGVIAEALSDKDTKVIILKRDSQGNINYANIETPLVLQATSYPEISYQAFGTASTDYHNALYGYIEAEGWKDEFNKTLQPVPYIKEYRGTVMTINISPSEKIRHMIHHPENKHNVPFSEGDLKNSIEAMRTFIISKQPTP